MTDYFMYANAYGSNERVMIQRLPLYLKGATREVYNQIYRRDIVQWIAMKDALSEKLISGDVGRIMRQKFNSRIQKAGESMSEFAFHLSTLVGRLSDQKQIGQYRYKKHSKINFSLVSNTISKALSVWLNM